MSTVLFVCVENTFRSVLSEALFNASPPSGWRAESAGVQAAAAINPVVVGLLQEIGIRLGPKTPRTVTPEMIARASRVVTFGCLDRCAAGANGIAVLRRGGRALDAVVESIVVLEDDPRLNAGTGSRMRIDGRIQMDAALMDADLEAGGVAAIEEVKNPIRVARDVFGTPHVLLVGSDATAFARKMGHVRYDPATPESRRRLKESLTRIRKGRVPRYARKSKSVQLAGTVGAVARDRRGRFAAGTSTGG